MAGVLAGAGRSHPAIVQNRLVQHSLLVRGDFPLVNSMNRIAGLLLVTIITAAACAPNKEEKAREMAVDSVHTDSINRARRDSINRASPGYVVDSILPVEEEVRRFRDAVGGEPVTALAGGSRSREALVRRFMRALAADDSAELRAMELNAREFADLVYPESPYTHAPYRQSPALVWNQIQNPSASGFTRLVRRLGNQPLQYLDHSCDAKADRQGRNLIWTNCAVRLTSPNGDKTKHRLFGSIIQRDDSFKIVSYRNEF
jgi:hypothetical protein